MAIDLRLHSDDELYELNDALHEVIARMIEYGQTKDEIEHGSLSVLWKLQLRLTELRLGTRATPGTDAMASRVAEAIASPRLVGAEPATCIGCGCTDDRACADEHGEPCHWLLVDREAGLGVCSECPDELDRWNAGDREIAVPVATSLLN